MSSLGGKQRQPKFMGEAMTQRTLALAAARGWPAVGVVSGGTERVFVPLGGIGTELPCPGPKWIEWKGVFIRQPRAGERPAGRGRETR